MFLNGNIFLVLTDLEKNLPIYLSCIGGSRNQRPERRPEGWPDYQWIQCISGKGKLELYGKTHVVSAGQGMLLYPHECHEYYGIAEPWETRWFSFNGKLVHELLKCFRLEHSQILSLSDPDPFLKNMYDLLTVASSNVPLKSLECSSLVYQMIFNLYRYASMTNVPSRHQNFEQLSPALRYIEEQYDQPIALRDLSDQLGVSPHHTCFLFRQTLGMRPFEYIAKLRMRRAKELLMKEPELDILEVGRRVGYDNRSYFIKMFKRLEGISPGKYREYM